MKRKEKLLLAGLAVFSISVYLITSALGEGPGFPLDDSWIHQTYARNLAQTGQWAFVPGVPSAGATSLLWVILLAPGHLLGLSPFLWTFLLGGIVLWALSLTAWRAADLLLPSKRRWPMLVAIFILFEWHLVWAAVSGMETLLFAWLVAGLLTRLLSLPKSGLPAGNFWWLSGGLVGLASLTRPEGLTLLAPLLLAALIYMQESGRRVAALAQSLAAFAAVFLPFLLFNLNLSGNLWPNTFYAKQAEYAVLLEQPILNRLIGQFGLPLVGAGLLLLPAFFFLIYRARLDRRWSVLLCAAWAVGFLGVYALRLAVTFQHGRYAIPMMPIYFILALAGLAEWLRLNDRSLLPRISSRVWLFAILALQIAFWGRGARAYRQDVAFIEQEMVAAAHWVKENTFSNSLIAAHDIGALGYFAERPLLDLAGLISPDVIPFLRDEDRLAEYLDVEGAEYLMTFPDWYPQLSAQAQIIYRSDGIASQENGIENMAIYLWRRP